MKAVYHPVDAIELLSRVQFRLRSNRVWKIFKDFLFLVRGLLVYSVSSAPFIIHISAVYRAGVTAIAGITSMLDRSQALPSEEICMCVCVFWFVQQLCASDSLKRVHVYV